MELQSGVKVRVKKPSPVKGVAEYFDPLQEQFKGMQQYHETLAKEKENQKIKGLYVQEVKEIPIVSYHPADLAAAYQSGDMSAVQRMLNPIKAKVFRGNPELFEDTTMENPYVREEMETKHILQKRRGLAPSLAHGKGNSQEHMADISWSQSFSATSLNQMPSVMSSLTLAPMGSAPSSSKGGLRSPSWRNPEEYANLSVSERTAQNIKFYKEHRPIKTSEMVETKSPGKKLSKRSKTLPNVLAQAGIGASDQFGESAYASESSGNERSVSPQATAADSLQSQQQKLRRVLTAAKKGDMQVLYSHFMEAESETQK